MPEKLPVSRVRFNMSDGSAVVSYPRPDISHRLQDQMEEAGYTLKDEHHITLLPRLDPEVIAQLGLGRMRQMGLLVSSPVDDVQLITDRIYEVRKPKITPEGEYERRSIIVATQSDKLIRIRRRLGTMGITMLPPFLHMTLATAGDEPYASRGIGIDNLKEFFDAKHALFPPKD